MHTFPINLLQLLLLSTSESSARKFGGRNVLLIRPRGSERVPKEEQKRQRCRNHRRAYHKNSLSSNFISRSPSDNLNNKSEPVSLHSLISIGRAGDCTKSVPDGVPGNAEQDCKERCSIGKECILDMKENLIESKAPKLIEDDLAIKKFRKRFTSNRGTKLTGAGSSKQNLSIFSSQAPIYQRLTPNPLSGEKAINPMAGRLWAKLSERGTLIFKIPSDGDEGGKPVYIELGKRDDNDCKANQIKSSKQNTNHPEFLTSESTLNASIITYPDTTIHNLPFIPVEGIYGIYDLPCSGPHAVLITESEEIYRSPLSQHQGPDAIPLIELRRIKSLEIVPLLRHNSDLTKSQTLNLTSISKELMLEEETRQLRLLRNSFKEHDFYFTVPRSSDGQSSIVLQDITHSLQSSFLNWEHGSKISKNRGVKHSELTSIGHRWWLPYYTEQNYTSDRPRHVPDPRFFWNEQPALELIYPLLNSVDSKMTPAESPYGRLLDRVIPVTSAFVGVEENIPIPLFSSLSSSSLINESYDQLLISRRSKYRTGTRFTRRGADDTGAVANYAETEQICLVTRNDDMSKRILSEVYSHVQTRGSIPLHWSSPADVKTYRPRVYIGVDPMVQARGLRDHLLGELRQYSFPRRHNLRQTGIDVEKLCLVNLIDKKGDQGRLGLAFDSVLNAVTEIYGSVPLQKPEKKLVSDHRLFGTNSIKHIWYDFHAECKGGRWDKLSHLLDDVSPILQKHSYLCIIPTSEDGNLHWRITNIQDGVVRTNCMDCLDRTNVVQSIFGRYILHRQLYERLGTSPQSTQNKPMRSLPLECVIGFKQRPLTLPWMDGEKAHRNLWANNADAISRLYAGTPALKGDFTRTGVRTKRGVFDDGMNSLQRYYLNNFIDADRQEGMDLLAGSAEFNNFPQDDYSSSRITLLHGLADSERRGYNKNHVRIKWKNDRSNQPMLSWLPGDLRHHMKTEALRSRSPLSSAASEEDLNVEKSSDFLMAVSSSMVNTQYSQPEKILHSMDRRLASNRPWWALSKEDGRIDRVKNPFPLLFLLLSKAPIVVAAVSAAFISCGFGSTRSSNEIESM